MATATRVPPTRSPRAPNPPRPLTSTPATPATPATPVTPAPPAASASLDGQPWRLRHLSRGLCGLRGLKRLPERLLSPWRSHPLRRNTDFLVLVVGQAVSVAGSGASTLALPLLVLWLTHSAVQAGLLGAVRLIPYAALALPAGALVDRCNRKQLMIACDAGRAMLMGSVPLVMLLTGHLWLPQLYLVSLGEGILFVFFDLAETASTVQVVGRDALPTAVAVSTTVANSAQLVGPLVGGALYAVGRLVPLAVDALTYGASVLSLTQIRASFQASPPRPSTPSTPSARAPHTAHARLTATTATTTTTAPPTTPETASDTARRASHQSFQSFSSDEATPRQRRIQRPSRTLRRRSTGHWGAFWGEARVGLSLVWGHPTLRALLLLGAAWNTVVTGFSLLVVVRAQALHASSLVVGLVLAAAGVGSVIGPLVGTPFSRRLGLARVALGGALGEALLWPLLGWAGTPLALAGVVALLMASDQIFNVAQYTWRLSLLPTAALGRATAAFRLALLGTQPVGLALMGLLLTHWGAAPTARWCGVILLAAACALGWQVVAPTRSPTRSPTATGDDADDANAPIGGSHRAVDDIRRMSSSARPPRAPTRGLSSAHVDDAPMYHLPGGGNSDTASERRAAAQHQSPLHQHDPPTTVLKHDSERSERHATS